MIVSETRIRITDEYDLGNRVKTIKHKRKSKSKKKMMPSRVQRIRI